MGDKGVVQELVDMVLEDRACCQQQEDKVEPPVRKLAYQGFEDKVGLDQDRGKDKLALGVVGKFERLPEENQAAVL